MLLVFIGVCVVSSARKLMGTRSSFIWFTYISLAYFFKKSKKINEIIFWLLSRRSFSGCENFRQFCALTAMVWFRSIALSMWELILFRWCKIALNYFARDVQSRGYASESFAQKPVSTKRLNVNKLSNDTFEDIDLIINKYRKP